MKIVHFCILTMILVTITVAPASAKTKDQLEENEGFSCVSEGIGGWVCKKCVEKNTQGQCIKWKEYRCTLTRDRKSTTCTSMLRLPGEEDGIQRPSMPERRAVHQKAMSVSSMDKIEAPEGVAEGIKIQGNQIIIDDGYSFVQRSPNEGEVRKRGMGVTGTITCDACTGKGSCTLSRSGGKLFCASTCDRGCVTVIKIPLPKLRK